MDSAKLQVERLRICYHNVPAVHDLSLECREREITALIGPSSSGKTSVLRALNRTYELVSGATVSGAVRLDGEDIFAIKPTSLLRRRIGMVSPLPVGLPMSVLDNVTFAPRMAGVRHRTELEEIAESCLRAAALWDEVKDRLSLNATRLSGGQQQRLAIARTLSHRPEVLCLDEFSIAVDPVTTRRIEDALLELKSRMAILVVTNLPFQARRIADRTGVLMNGYLLDFLPTAQLFEGSLTSTRAREYLEGRLG